MCDSRRLVCTRRQHGKAHRLISRWTIRVVGCAKKQGLPFLACFCFFFVWPHRPRRKTKGVNFFPPLTDSVRGGLLVDTFSCLARRLQCVRLCRCFADATVRCARLFIFPVDAGAPGLCWSARPRKEPGRTSERPGRALKRSTEAARQSGRQKRELLKHEEGPALCGLRCAILLILFGSAASSYISRPDIKLACRNRTRAGHA